MKTLFTILSILFFSCKKDEVKPQENTDYKERYDIRWYTAAYSGEDSIDGAIAIQAAIDATIKARGGIVFIPTTCDWLMPPLSPANTQCEYIPISTETRHHIIII